MNRTGAINYQEYRERYNAQCTAWRSQPVQERRVNDPVCIAIFILLTLIFFGVGGYYITTKDQYYGMGGNPDSDVIFDEYKGQIISCIFGSIVVSLLYILLIKLMPAIMVYVMIIVSLGMIAFLAFLGLINQNYGLAIPMAITFLIYSCLLFCFRQRIRMGIVLVKVATKFISAKPIVFITPIIKIFLTFLFAVFWIYTWSLMIQKANDQQDAGDDPTMANAFTGVWVLLWLFYTFFFYYMMVFTIAVTCAFWYYSVEGKNPIISSYRWIYKSAFGSLTFAALVIAIVTFIRLIVNAKRNNTRNPVAACCLCIVACLLRQIQALLKILNHNTVICMAVTGESFIDGAKTTLGIICSDLSLFAISRLITNLLVFWGTILAVGIPAVIGYLWIQSLPNGDQDAFTAMIIIIFGSVMVSGITYAILVESVSSVFVFYCFDRRFKELGYQSHNMPIEINQALGNTEYEARQSYGKLYEDQ